MRKLGLTQEALAVGLDGHGDVCRVGCSRGLLSGCWICEVFELERETWVEEARPGFLEPEMPVWEGRVVGIDRVVAVAHHRPLEELWLPLQAERLKGAMSLAGRQVDQMSH